MSLMSTIRVMAEDSSYELTCLRSKLEMIPGREDDVKLVTDFIAFLASLKEKRDMSKGMFYVLCNKPGRLSFGTQEDFDNEDENGYAPVRISESQARSHAIQGDSAGYPEDGGRWSVHLYSEDLVSVPSWFSWCLKRQEIMDSIRPQLREVGDIDETLRRIEMALGACANMKDLTPPEESKGW
jgi:hypothetical protein